VTVTLRAEGLRMKVCTRPSPPRTLIRYWRVPAAALQVITPVLPWRTNLTLRTRPPRNAPGAL
jgi:hypothetical protein